MNKISTKIASLFFLFFSTSVVVYSQDLIVTEKGDSLNCKITKIKEDYIYFIFKHENEIRNTLLPIKQVKQHQYAFYQTAIVPADYIPKKAEYPRFRIAITGGFSYRIASIGNMPPDLEEFYKKLKSGSNFGLDGSYYFSEYSGIGLKYSLFQSEVVLHNAYIPSENIYGTFSEDIAISFIGPIYSSRIFNKTKKNCFLMNLGIGYMGYKNDGLVNDNYFTAKGGTLGLCLDFEYDIRLAKELALGFQVSY